MSHDPEPVRRRPVRQNTNLVQTVLDRLAKEGVTWAPRFISIDAQQEILSWLPGSPSNDWTNPDRLDQLTLIVRDLHDLTATMTDEGECIVHDDLQPRNVVVDGDTLGLIDWEQVRPGRRAEDLAQICWSFAGPDTNETVAEVGSRWRRILDCYGALDRTEVIPVALAKIRQCIQDIERESRIGSASHQLMVERGDHNDLQANLEWIELHETTLVEAIA